MKTTEALKKAIEIKGRRILADERLLTAVLSDLVREDDEMFRLIRHVCSDRCFDMLAKCRDEEISGASAYVLSRMSTYYSRQAVRDVEELLDFCFPDAGVYRYDYGTADSRNASGTDEQNRTVYCKKRLDISHVTDVGMYFVHNICRPGDKLPVSGSFYLPRSSQHQTFMILENGRPLKCRTFNSKDSSAELITVAAAVNQDSSLVMRCYAEDHYSDFQSIDIAPSFLDEFVIRITAEDAVNGRIHDLTGLYLVISQRSGVKVDDIRKYADMPLETPDLYGSHFYDGQYICYSYRNISPVLLKMEIILPQNWTKITYQDVEYLLKIDKNKAKKGNKVTVKMLYGNDIEVVLPADAFEGQRIRISGKGLPGYDGKTGDCYLKVSLV